jgi:hypothetical protein
MLRSAAVLLVMLVVSVACGQDGAGASAPAAPTVQTANALIQQGKFTEAAAQLETVAQREPQNANAWFLLGYAHHAAGDLAKALPLHAKAAAFPQVRPVALYNLGCAHALLGHADDAFQALRLSVDAGQVQRAQFEGDPDLTSLHNDPRWAELLARIDAVAQRPASNAMNFWVGSWDCYAPDGTLAGRNTLAASNHGLFISESWTNAQGQSGASVNYYDIQRGVWRQIWLDPANQLVMDAVPTTPGELLFEGENFGRDGAVTYRRMLVTSLSGGRVLQHGMQSDDRETWTTSYRLIYIPTGQPFDGSGLPADPAP